MSRVCDRLQRAGALALGVLVVLLAACSPTGAYTGTVIAAGRHAVSPGEAWRGDVILLDGVFVLQAGGEVWGSLYLLSGAAEIDGDVRGDISLIGGELRLGPGATVGGAVNVGGGVLERSPGARVQGGVDTGTGLQVPRAGGPGWIQIALQGAVVALLAYLLARYWPRPLERVMDSIAHHPVVAASMGLLAGVVALVLLVLMAFTLLLIPVALLGGLILLLALSYGWAGFGALMGRWLLPRLGSSRNPPRAAFLGTLAFMLLLGLSRAVPVLHDLLQLVTGLIGFGAVLLTRFGRQRFVPAVDREPERAFPPPPTS